MDVKITDKNDNPLLLRKEVSGTMTFNGAVPSQDELIKALAKSEGAKSNLIYIDSIGSKYGFQEANFRIFIYETEEAMTKCHKKGKKLLEKEKKAVEAKKKKAEEKETSAEAEKPAAKAAPKEEKKEEEKPAEEAKPAEKKEEPAKEEKKEEATKEEKKEAK